MCNRPMGVENGRIRNAQITASSEFNKAHAAFLARLNRKKTGGYIGAWAAAANNYAQWLKVDFGRAAKIVRVSTQGRQDADQWVTTYYLSYSIDCVNYVYYRYHGSYKVRTQQLKNPVHLDVVCYCFHPLHGWNGWYATWKLSNSASNAMIDYSVVKCKLMESRISTGYTFSQRSEIQAFLATP